MKFTTNSLILLSSLLLHSFNNESHITTVQANHAGGNHPTRRPKQGVFLLSNQPNNEVGVYESMDDGSLIWKNRYSTGGTGYPDPLDRDNLDDLGSSNAVHYHAWNNRQWLLAANAGGPNDDDISSLSLFEIDSDLTLRLTDHVPLVGTFPCTVTGHSDRACVATCALNVTVECFQIDSTTGLLTNEFVHDFQQNLPEPEGRPNRVSAVHGPGNLLFSPDGKQLGLVMKGSETLPQPHPSQAGFWSFPVYPRTRENVENGNDGTTATSTPSSRDVNALGNNNTSFGSVGGGYGRPSFVPIDNVQLPFAFAWRSGTESGNPLAAVVNIAGASRDFPECDEDPDGPRCYSSVTIIQTNTTQAFATVKETTTTASISRSSLSNTTGTVVADGLVGLDILDDVPLNVIDACWIEYIDDRMYTGNFFSDSITITTLLANGTSRVERTVPIGVNTVPNDLASTGPKLDGTVYLYSENQGVGGGNVLQSLGNLGVHRIIQEEGLVQVLTSSPLPSGRAQGAWVGNNGLAATSLSEQELFDLYGYQEEEGESEEDGFSSNNNNNNMLRSESSSSSSPPASSSSGPSSGARSGSVMGVLILAVSVSLSAMMGGVGGDLLFA